MPTDDHHGAEDVTAPPELITHIQAIGNAVNQNLNKAGEAPQYAYLLAVFPLDGSPFVMTSNADRAPQLQMMEHAAENMRMIISMDQAQAEAEGRIVQGSIGAMDFSDADLGEMIHDVSQTVQ